MFGLKNTAMKSNIKRGWEASEELVAIQQCASGQDFLKGSKEEGIPSLMDSVRDYYGKENI
jgi:hypothetical protein